MMGGRKKDIHNLLSEARATGGHVRGSIRLPTIEVRERKGKTVYRWAESESGGDFPGNPIRAYLKLATKTYFAGINKVLRVARLVEGRAKGTKTNQQRKALLAAEVLRLWEQHRTKGRGRAGLIARQLGITSRRVRQIIKEEITETT